MKPGCLPFGPLLDHVRRVNGEPGWSDATAATWLKVKTDRARRLAVDGIDPVIADRMCVRNGWLPYDVWGRLAVQTAEIIWAYHNGVAA